MSQVYECATLAQAYDGSIDWRFIEGRLQRHRLNTPLEAYVLASSRLFRLPWPLSNPPGLAAHFHHLQC